MFTEMTKKERRNELKEKKIRMMLSNPVIIDNHDHKQKTITGLVEFTDGCLACCFDARYYSLNACELQDGKLHCSTTSIGGVLWGGHPSAEQLKEYNEAVMFAKYIKCIHFANGDIVYPAA